MKLYVIRHGESLNNSAKRWTGWLNVPLTEKGYEDAKKAGNFLKEIKFDKIYSSDLIRAVETAKTAIPGCDPILTSLIREINVGDLSDQPLSTLSPEDLAYAGENGYDKWNGESSEEFTARAEAFLQKMAREETGVVAAFAHGGMLKRLLRQVLELPVPGNKICCDNCAIAVFEITPTTRRLRSWINLD